jgi:hypothetical protein
MRSLLLQFEGMPLVVYAVIFALCSAVPLIVLSAVEDAWEEYRHGMREKHVRSDNA